MKKILLFLLCITTIGVCVGQNERYFDYDASGNRVLRTIVFPMMTDRSMPTSEESNWEQNTEFTDKIGEISYKAFPNPTMGELTITIENYNDLAEGRLSLYNVNGQLLESYEMSEATLTINLSSYAAGVYFLKLQMNNGVKDWKIIKE